MQYLNKNFFKFTLGFLCLICIGLFAMYFATTFADKADSQVAQPVSVP